MSLPTCNETTKENAYRKFHRDQWTQKISALELLFKEINHRVTFQRNMPHVAFITDMMPTSETVATLECAWHFLYSRVALLHRVFVVQAWSRHAAKFLVCTSFLPLTVYVPIEVISAILLHLVIMEPYYWTTKQALQLFFFWEHFRTDSTSNCMHIGHCSFFLCFSTVLCTLRALSFFFPTAGARL